MYLSHQIIESFLVVGQLFLDVNTLYMHNMYIYMLKRCA